MRAVGKRPPWAGISCNRGRRAEGFLLPLAGLSSVLLLFGSLSVQAVSLQGQRRLEMEQHLRQAEDRLASAAQALVARIQLHHPCLLPLAKHSWPQAGCADAAALEALAAGELLGSAWQLLGWQPTPAPVDPHARLQAMELLIAQPASPGGAPLRSIFRLQLVGRPWRVLDLRPMGWRGEVR